MSRTMLTALGIFLVVGIAFIVAKPDGWLKYISSSPATTAAQGPSTGDTTSYKVRFTKTVLSQSDPYNSPDDLVAIDADYSPATPGEIKKMLFGGGEERSTLPLRNNPYLMVVVKDDNRIRFVPLTSAVREISLLNGSASTSVAGQKLVPSGSTSVTLKKQDVTPGGPVQYILWLKEPMDVQLEVKAVPTFSK